MSRCKAQNLLEYTILFSLILSAILIMQVYIKRSYQGRLKQEADSLGEQYSPGHTTGSTTITTTIDTKTHVGGETDDGVPVPEGVSVSFSEVNTTTDKYETVDAFAEEE